MTPAAELLDRSRAALLARLDLPQSTTWLAAHLGLPEPPQRVEGFDISHFQGGETVASMVVWEAGKMRKSDYRTFNVRGLTGPDDPASIAQAVERRYKRVLEEVGAVQLSVTVVLPEVGAESVGAPGAVDGIADCVGDCALSPFTLIAVTA